MTFWNTFTDRARELVQSQLDKLNLDIMCANMEGDAGRKRDLKRRRTELERAITAGDRRRATTICMG